MPNQEQLKRALKTAQRVAGNGSTPPPHVEIPAGANEPREPPLAASPRRFGFGQFGSIKMSASVEYLVAGILPAKGVVLVYGAPKCGKSFWTFDLAMSVARSATYRGNRVQGGAVAYLAAEGGGGFPKRVEAYRQKHNCPADTPFFLCTARADLIADAPDLIASVKAQLGGARPALVVVDTINRTFVGNENDARDMARYLAAAASIEDAFACAVILIHHSGLVARRPRGSTSLPAGVETQISVERDAAENVIATVQLAKDGESGIRIASRLEVVTVGKDENCDKVTSCIIVPAEAAPSKVKAVLSPQIELARRALAEVIADQGKPNIIIPAGLKGVPEDAWRDECYRRGIGGPEKPALRKAFNRAKESLAVRGIIGIRDGIVWLTFN
jgi:hypothetical protein